MKLAGLGLAFACIVLAGCAAAGMTSGNSAADLPARRMVLSFDTPTPDPKHLYVDHDGTFSVYELPLTHFSKPLRTFPESSPGALPPQIAGDQFGNVALATATQVSIFDAPIVSFAAKHARLVIPLNPSITQIGGSGAVLSDIEFDSNQNLWLLNNYGGGQVTELQAPLHKYMTAAASVLFGVPGTKSAPYGSVLQARFDVGGNLYVYATQPQGEFSLLFKSGFPYAKPPSPFFGLDLSTPDFIDPSQWINGPPPALAGGLLIGQYKGLLASPAPGKSPPLPVSVLAQFTEPIFDVNGVFPSAHVNDVSAALVADPNRSVFYSLSASNGALEVYGLPLSNGAKPHVRLPCSARLATLCSNKPEHLFFAP